jgi:predicted  nucleic acid-binding Zn-ribbon protein
VACDDYQRLLKEVQNLRAEGDEFVKKLRYKMMRAELAFKVKEMQCLRKHNDGLIKWNQVLQAKDDHLTKLIEELEENNDALKDLSGCLMMKERESNDELRQAREEIINLLLILYVH